MSNFDEVAKEMGWIKPYEEVPLWYKEKDGMCIAKFSINSTYQNYQKHDVEITPETVEGSMGYFNGNTFSCENKDWALPMLAADYFHHEFNFGRIVKEKIKEELKYAKMACDVQPELAERGFSPYIREKLLRYLKEKK